MLRVNYNCMLLSKTYVCNHISQANKNIHVLHQYLHTYINHSPHHSPAIRLSRAVLLSMSRALEVDDLRWSLKDLCSSSNLMERDMPISIHRNLSTSVSYLVSTPVPAPASVPCQSHPFPLLLFFFFLSCTISLFKSSITI